MGQAKKSLAFAKAGHKAARKQLPMCEGRKKLARVSLRGRKSNKMEGVIPRTQLVGAAAAAVNCNTASRVMAAVATRWLSLVPIGYFGDFGITS